MTQTVLHLLADGRLPVGGHAHSGGLESAIATGRLDSNPQGLTGFLTGRLTTSGLVAAAIAARGWELTIEAAPESQWQRLDRETDARMLCPHARTASRSQGRGMLRLLKAGWPDSIRAAIRTSAVESAPDLPPGSGLVPRLGAAPHLAPTQGAAVALAKGDRLAAARLAAYGSVSGPAWAAVRLLSLDPVGVSALLIELSQLVEAVSTQAVKMVEADELPALAAPMLEILSSVHSQSEVRYFAS